jgi:ATP-dependent Lon protease
VGVVKGLAVSPWGGETLDIEVALVPGKGAVQLTGRLGDWLKESATTGLTWIRSRAGQGEIAENFQEHLDIHIHYPGNALKTDGPSAGAAMATALWSALSGRPVRADVAMTGEISLRGRVLRIGGLREKLLAAHRAGITTAIIPEENRNDLDNLPDEVRAALTIFPVASMDQVLEIALLQAPSDFSQKKGEACVDDVGGPG